MTFESAAEFNNEYGEEKKRAPKEAKTCSRSCGLGGPREAEARGAMKSKLQSHSRRLESESCEVGHARGPRPEQTSCGEYGIQRGVRVQQGVERQPTELQHEHEDLKVCAMAEEQCASGVEHPPEVTDRAPQSREREEKLEA
ncbi:hypothetical protein FB451DRAFT_1189706 [Mycena latifolia]|nr:hypothetical protein FB451DRAFT_1189706 [Mycena latifolia]